MKKFVVKYEGVWDLGNNEKVKLSIFAETEAKHQGEAADNVFRAFAEVVDLEKRLHIYEVAADDGYSVEDAARDADKIGDAEFEVG